MEIVQTNNTEYRDEIISLYTETFSTGLSKQYINKSKLNKYIDIIFEKGNVLLALENSQVTGALLTCPLKYDKSLPKEISGNFPVEKCVYVAEIIVAELSRGKGIGKQLMSNFLVTVDKLQYTDAFIRVWKENVAALGLYRKIGFESYTSIQQIKTNADGNGTFVMDKIYLHKKLN